MSKSWSPRSHSSRNPIGPAPTNPPGAARRRVLMGAAVALMAIAVVALPAAAQNQSVTTTGAATGANPPAKPHNLQVSPSHDQVTLTWTASTDPTVTRYAVLRRNRTTDAVGVFHVIAANAGPGTGYTDSSVSASGSYVYRVKSVSPTGVSQWSGYARADTPAAPEPPPPPPTTTTQPPPPPTTTTTQAPPPTTTTTQAPPPTTTTQAPPPTTTTTQAPPPTTTTQAPTPVPVTITPVPVTVALAPVIGFTLVDATNQAVLARFSDDVTLELDDPDNASFGVRVDTGAGVTIGSVRLELSGQKTEARTENWAPYSLYGDDGSALHGNSLPAGSYTLRATAYPNRGLQGNPLGTLEVSITVTAPEPATITSDDPAPEGAANQEGGPLQYLEAGTEDFVPRVLTYQVFTDTDADSVVPLDWALKPSGLNGGDQFRLLFTTHTGTAPRTPPTSTTTTTTSRARPTPAAPTPPSNPTPRGSASSAAPPPSTPSTTPPPPGPTPTGASPSTGSTATRSPTTTRTSTTAPGTTRQTPHAATVTSGSPAAVSSHRQQQRDGDSHGRISA